ncbi:MAG TPA: IPT/TIG domain-containing protein, partial [Candidatus Krumholzibacterium sp.]|nr:IPT/TIG domain-containing protein [Candidatus Krumholzibacterium sp.]
MFKDFQPVCRRVTGFRWAVCIIFAMISISIYSCSDDDKVSMDRPVITGISQGSASVGDTITLTGEGFGRDMEGFMVAFSGCGFNNSRSYRDSQPLSIWNDSIVVEVPDGAFSGWLRLHWDNPLSGSGPFDLTVPPQASNVFDIDIDQSAGDVAKVFYSGSEYEFELGEEDEASDYLLVLFSGGAPVTGASGYSYFLDNGITQPVDGPAAESGAGFGSQAPVGTGYKKEEMQAEVQEMMMESGPLPREFEKRRMTEFLELAGSSPSSGGKSGRTNTIVSHAPGGAPQAVVFNVYSDWLGSTIDPASFVQVNAVLAYEGDHSLLYVDEDTPENCLSTVEAGQLGEAFDTSIYGTDRAAFGEESDINSDGKVAILLSPVINGLTEAGTAGTSGFIAGFFLPGDLIPAYMPAGSTNGMEIFYTMVPDPTGTFGNVYEKTRALEVIRGVLAHEFLHMIMFNYRILLPADGLSGAYMPEVWVSEGLAHTAEDLNGHDESNIGRSNLFLADPGAVSLIHGGDALDERGAAFLFFRYLGDRFGEGVFREIVQTRAVGTRNIE